MYPQLSGRSSSPSSERSLFGPIAVCVVVLAAALAYLTWTFMPRATPVAVVSPSVPVPLKAPAEPVIVGPTEDQQLRLAHADEELVRAAEQVTAARRLLAALGPDLSRSYLTFERRRSDAAWSACDVAAQALEQARDDLKVVASTGKD